MPERGGDGGGRWVDTADRIAREIITTAVWHEDRCNWIGADVAGEDYAGRPLPCHRALNAATYAGTSGVASFLAEFHAVTGDAGARTVALGAIRHALALERKQHGGGLFTGAVGVALAAVRAGELLDAPTLCESAVVLMDSTVDSGSPEYDLLGGSAGEAVGLLGLARLTGEPRFLDRATRLGDRLLQGAEREPSGWSWPSAAQSTPRNLTGFSHGAAGIAYALAELHHATGAEPYRRGALEALAYERAHYDHTKLNWPDFRTQDPDEPPGFPVFWCHGAPGIALSRLGIWQRLGDRRARDEALVALSTTRVELERELDHPAESFCLCHGAAGNADVLLHGAAVLAADGRSDARTLAEDIARLGEQAHGATGSWPCGVPSGQTPNLMLGLAGIGVFFLRLHDARIPSPLLP